jgi:hypothetical protein
MIARLYELQYPTIVGYILRALQLLLMPGRFQEGTAKDHDSTLVDRCQLLLRDYPFDLPPAYCPLLLHIPTTVGRSTLGQRLIR